MVYLSRIYTKTGDQGETALGDGTRVPKDHVRVTGASDGKVCLSETRVEGMTDWLCVERSHALLHLDPAVIGQAIHFLCQGFDFLSP